MARTVPTMPPWSANQAITSTLLNQITTYAQYMSSPPCFRAEQHTVQTVASGTNTQITCETTIHDSDSCLSTSSPYSYVVPVAGVWDFDGGFSLVSNTAGLRIPAIWQNGGTINSAGPASAQVATSVLFNTAAHGVVCNVGDVIALYAYQTSGSALSTAVSTSGQYSWFAGKLVSLQNP